MKRLHSACFVLLPYTYLLLHAAAPVRADIRREAEALVKWKASLAGADDLGSWSLANSTRLCNWTCITCDSARHVRRLDISLASLNGTLDEFDFSAFPHLKELLLINSDLHGTIPAGFGNLTSLVKLDIGKTNLRGRIPRSIRQLKHLAELYMVDLGLDGTLPEEIGNLTNLKELHLSALSLTGPIPPTIGMLRKLRVLSLVHSKLTGTIPMEIGNMTELQFVNIMYNCLGGQLPENQLEGHIVPELGNSSQLESIGIANNNFSGLFPSSICVGGALKTVSAEYNGFTSIHHQTFQNCTTLQYVDFTANNIVAELRDCNNFSGTIPSWASRSLPELNFLRLSSNMFDGIIPHQILQFRKLQVLDLSKNKLTGPIPDDFRNFTGMVHEQEDIDYIYDGYTTYAPEIQIVWKNVDQLYIVVIAGMAGIDLSGNSLSQEIPNGLTTLLAIRYLNLSGNHLSGFIPEDIGNLVLLESLDLSRSQLSGEIPPSFTDLKSITVLNLSSNSLSGRIPTGDQLRTLDDPSIYSNNLGLCGFPLEDCVSSSTPTQTETSLDEDRETLWFYCFVAAGFISGFWLYWGTFLFRSETRRYSLYQYVDNMQAKVTKKMYSCMKRFQANEQGPECQIGRLLSSAISILDISVPVSELIKHLCAMSSKCHPDNGMCLHHAICAFTPVRANTRREAEALLNWKASLGGANEFLESWSSANSTSICRWKYISCNSARHIRELDLSDANLNGTLDEFDFSAFPHLKRLIMYQSGLYGTIPAGIANLTSLVVLQIIDNPYLGGAIPRSIGQLKHLAVLELALLGLSGTIPEEIGNLTSLKGLYLNSGALTGSIPQKIGTLKKLDTLSLEDNNLTGSIPPDIGNMTELQALFFSDNCLEGELPDLRDCFAEHPGYLRKMSFRQNHLYGTFLTDLGEVFVSNYTYLFFLDLSNNALDGDLSKSSWDMPYLAFMDLSSNSFSGVVPFSWTCDSLNYLHLANNHFEGTFPLFLLKCKNLITLDLGGNNFSGPIPSWVLDLSKNKLTGPIPSDFTNFTGMTQEPKNIENAYSDHYMYAERIEIVWKNVDHVYNIMIAAIAGIDLSGNSLTLEIPNGLTTLLGLRYLNLSGNHLSGSIPEDIGNLVLLESLDLSRNKLSGEIPISLAGLKDMSSLNLSSNGLSGRIPTGSQLQTLVDPSIYGSNPGLCGFPLKDCVNSSTPTQTETSQAEDRETLWFYCFVAAGFICGFWLYWGIFLFSSETWRFAFYQYVDNMQAKVTKKMYSCMSRFQASGSE
ncbi:MDIS1-interacting receptor like kinase 2-like [Triticum dicoccoides]|uniref:MDIS1-interacting receptor like kinase 2-like n=1 Tax=Triticum dicoccoides TaxID=85692 RepID=UPI00188F2C9D|nr:MDIS1-interacting receptor like kinase 2-like [Triticum dicoccoides]